MKPQEKARRLRPLIVKASASLSDEDALEAIELIDQWKADAEYDADIRVGYNGKLYRCVQSHTSQAHYTPDLIPAIWTEVALPGEIPVWRQPTGTQDAYRTGDRVRYPDAAGPVYESLIDHNVYSPEAYPAGWRAVA